MGLESATYLDDLNPSNPLSSDGMGQGDDHIRLIKSVLQNTFPNITGAVTSTQDTLNGSLVPMGVIVAFSPLAGSIPSGWAFCDGGTYDKSDGSGTIATPDLRAQFIRGASTFGGGGGTGGANSVTSGSSGSHDHSGGTGNTVLTTDQIPSHSHSLTDPGHTHTYTDTVNTGSSTPNVNGTNSGGSDQTRTSNTAYTGITISNTGGGLAHNHSISTDGSHTHTVSTVPAHTILAYIMKL